MPHKRIFSLRIRLALISIGLLFPVLASSAARAAAITVNSLTDSTPANNGQCTLREALLNANGNNQSGSTDCEPGSGTDTISFSVTGTIELTSMLPSLTSSMTITGPGAALLTIRRTGTAEFRIFTIIEGNTVGLSGLTIANGKAVSGGGIQSQNATLTITRCVISGSVASGSNSLAFGGGMLILGGSATIAESTIAGNSAANGGGISVSSGSSTTITASSITGNTSTLQAAGLSLQNSTVTITNSTISGNTAGSYPGGMTNYANAGRTASLALINCTIAANITGTPGRSTIDTLNAGSAAATQLKNTLVAGNTGANFSVSGTGASITSQGNNLDSDGSSGFVNGSNGDLVGTSGSPLDAKLGPLADNGGPTRTHALLSGSPAIDAGGALGAPLTDQRGQPRIGSPDIGAYEHASGSSQSTTTTLATPSTTTSTTTSSTTTVLATTTSIATTTSTIAATSSTTSSTTSTTLPSGVTLYFPQVAAGGGYRAFLVLNNPSSSAAVQGTVAFQKPDGFPWTLQIDNDSGSSRTFSLPARGSLKLTLPGQETQVKTGWCQVTATGTLGGVLTYQLLDGAEILSQASVPPSARMGGFTMAVPQMGGATDSGLAMANVEDQPTQVTLRFWKPDGTLAAETLLTLQVGEQVAAFISQMLPTLPTHQEGTLEVISNRAVIAVGLVYAGTAFATLPVLPQP